MKTYNQHYMFLSKIIDNINDNIVHIQDLNAEIN